jgi:diacylglycerol kinase (ATP)
MTTARKTTKLTGFAHFAAAAGYSAGGFVRAWKEAAFRQEIVAGAVLAAIYAAVGVDANTGLAASILFLLLLAFEALNTAIEDIVDRISPEVSLTAKHAKDLGSFAVFCLLLANGALFIRIVGQAAFG